MIICIDKDYLNTIGEVKASQLYCEALENGHFFDGKGDSMDVIRDSVEKHASSYQKELMKTGKTISLTGKLRKFLTTLKASDFSFDDLVRILNKPSKILVENSVYEGPVYDNMIQIYERDPSFRNLYLKLKEARKTGRLEYGHSGGFGNFLGLLEQADAEGYRGIAKYKFCTVIDRDADGPEYTRLSTRDSLFKFLSGKDSSQLGDDDIYTLKQSKYIWHMWYKREIENYFPDEQYERIGVHTYRWPAIPIDRNYKKISKGTGFSKDKLKDLTKGMSRELYEAGLQSFYHQGGRVSEIQLFLLKLVKLI